VRRGVGAIGADDVDDLTWAIVVSWALIVLLLVWLWWHG
jgi:hypothetical protein